MSKLVHAISLEALKLAYPTWAAEDSPIYRSVAFTDDGHLYTHGKVFKMASADETNPWGLDLKLSGQSLSVMLTGVSKSVTLPVIGIDSPSTDEITVAKSNGIFTLTHTAPFTGDTTAGATANSTSSIVVPKIISSKTGHVKSLTNFTATLNTVRQTVDTSTTNAYPLFSTGTTTADRTSVFNTTIKANLATSTLYANAFFQGGTDIAAIYAPRSHASSATTYGVGTASLYGHLKLSDATNLTSNATGGIAATPSAVKKAYEDAIQYAKDWITTADAMLFLGTIDGNGVILSYNREIITQSITIGTTNISALTAYKSGWTFKVTTVGTIFGGVEIGDMVVCTNDYATAYSVTDWTVIQANIDGAVTAVNSLANNCVVLGDSSARGVKTLGNGSNGQVLKLVSGVPAWSSDINNWRPITVGSTTLNDTTTAFNIKSANGISLGFVNGVLTITGTTYTGGTGLTLSGTTFNLNVASSSEIGGVKPGTTSGKNYGVSVASGGEMTVNVPWIDTTYGVGDFDSLGLIKPYKSYTVASTGITASTSATAVAVTGISTTAGRYYAIEMDNGGRAFVNVPWSDTHYTTRMYIGAATAASDAVTTNGNTYLKLFDNTTLRDQFKIVGAGAASVASDASGNLTITSVNTWRNVTAYKLSNNTSAEILSSSVGTADLDFGDEFLWNETGGSGNGQLKIGWAEIDASGKVTYMV